MSETTCQVCGLACTDAVCQACGPPRELHACDASLGGSKTAPDRCVNTAEGLAAFLSNQKGG